MLPYFSVGYHKYFIMFFCSLLMFCQGCKNWEVWSDQSLSSGADIFHHFCFLCQAPGGDRQAKERSEVSGPSPVFAPQSTRRATQAGLSGPRSSGTPDNWERWQSVIIDPPHTGQILGLTAGGNLMALEGFHENVAGWFSDFFSPLPPGLRIAAGDHLAAGTPSLGVINPVHCPEVG